MTATVDLFRLFADRAHEADVSWELSRCAGWYVEGGDGIDEDGRLLEPEEIPEEKRRPIERGYTVAVAQRYLIDDDGEEMVYPTLRHALAAGLRILHEVEAETGGAP